MWWEGDSLPFGTSEFWMGWPYYVSNNKSIKWKCLHELNNELSSHFPSHLSENLVSSLFPLQSHSGELLPSLLFLTKFQPLCLLLNFNRPSIVPFWAFVLCDPAPWPPWLPSMETPLFQGHFLRDVFPNLNINLLLLTSHHWKSTFHFLHSSYHYLKLFFVLYNNATTMLTPGTVPGPYYTNKYLLMSEYFSALAATSWWYS